MKKILIIQGVSNTGKTTIINNLIDWLLLNFTQTNTITLEGNGVDRFGVIEINGFRIGIISEGDTLAHTRLRLNEIHNQNCDVIICSCRTRMSSYTSVRGFLNLHNRTQLNYLSRWIPVILPISTQQNLRVFNELQTWLRGI